VCILLVRLRVNAKPQLGGDTGGRTWQTIKNVLFVHAFRVQRVMTVTSACKRAEEYVEVGSSEVEWYMGTNNTNNTSNNHIWNEG